MTDNKAPIEDRDANIRSIVAELLSEAYERLFDRYDQLHKRNIHDEDIIRALRQNGDGRVADDYIEWASAFDPDAEDDNTTMSPAVPDPGDMPSYENLEQAIVQAVVEKTREYRIERGIFYAEPSVMSGWNVYKKRSGDDSGAFIGHYADENAAINILTSLGDGYPTND